MADDHFGDLAAVFWLNNTTVLQVINLKITRDRYHGCRRTRCVTSQRWAIKGFSGGVGGMLTQTSEHRHYVGATITKSALY